jgi:hypothetical protein
VSCCRPQRLPEGYWVVGWQTMWRGVLLHATLQQFYCLVRCFKVALRKEKPVSCCWPHRLPEGYWVAGWRVASRDTVTVLLLGSLFLSSINERETCVLLPATQTTRRLLGGRVACCFTRHCNSFIAWFAFFLESSPSLRLKEQVSFSPES